MERLSFANTESYNGLEASIHLARYAFARSLCKGKAVLDMACGEGYGSRLLADWGALSVVGVDVSADAVARAQQLFGCPQVTYRVGAAEALAGMFAPASFDLIVSLETIEHVSDPAGLLGSFRQLLAPGGAIIVSCPNDWWYYPAEEERNPYHVRKYTFDEFRQASEKILGPANAWYYGAPVAGFGNTRIDGLMEVRSSDTQAMMLRSFELSSGFILPAEEQRGPRAKNASYFVGTWCDPADAPSSAVMQGAALLPASMDAFVQGFFAQTAAQTNALEHELVEARRMLALFNGQDVESAGGDGMDSQDVGAVNEELSASAPGEVSAEKVRRLSTVNRIDQTEKEVLRRQAARLSQLCEEAREQDEASRVMRQQLEIERALVRSAEERVEAQAQSEKLALQERDALQERYRQLAAHTELLQIEASRYRRLRDLVPAALRRMLLPAARRLRNIARGAAR